MSFEFDSRRVGAGALAVALTALLVWFGNGLNPWWPLMWLAPLPVLVFATRSSFGATALVAWLGWTLGHFSMWTYAQTLLELPATTFLGIAATLGLIFCLAVLLFRALLNRGAHWLALLAFPALIVSAEYVQNLTSIDGTGGNLAYTQLAFLPFLQLASLTGPWGMSFLLLLFPSALALGIHLFRTDRPRALRIAGVSLGTITAVLIFGAIRLALPAPGEPVKVGLIASDGPNTFPSEEGAPTDALFRAYGEQVAKLAADGAEVVVLPEKIGVTVDPDTQDTDAFLQSLADRHHVDIVAGLIRVALPVKYNEARVYVPGAPVTFYDKEHMLPPFESKYVPGKDLTFLRGHSDIWGVAICKDMDFTPLGRAYGKASAGLMLVPAWDFNVDNVHHGHMAIMRGVESGFSVVRSAKGGFLTVSDNRGRIVAETTSGSAPFATLLASVPAVHDGTRYLAWGDWFAWASVAIFLFTLAQLVRTISAVRSPEFRATRSPDTTSR